MRLALVAGLALAASVAVVQAQDQAVIPPACTAFAWPLLREISWFSAPGLPHVASGGTLAAELPGAVLDLKPVTEADFPIPPSRPPAEGSRGGVLRVPAPQRPGLYQVTLSDEAWIDVSQDGQTMLPTVAHTGKRDCPVLRKSVRYQVGTAPVIVAISGARVDSIRVAFAPAE